jgi:hypothetical protein
VLVISVWLSYRAGATSNPAQCNVVCFWVYAGAAVVARTYRRGDTQLMVYCSAKPSFSRQGDSRVAGVPSVIMSNTVVSCHVMQ